jgi:hypothetical protein
MVQFVRDESLVPLDSTNVGPDLAECSGVNQEVQKTSNLLEALGE